MSFNINGGILIKYKEEDNITDITIPDGVTSIGEWAFWCCDSLTSVTIPDSVTTIGCGAFEACHSLIRINIPDSVTSIGGAAFYCCHSLASINIPDSVTYIAYNAFRECDSLKSINIPSGVISIGNGTFDDMNIYDIVIMFRNKDFSIRINHDIKYMVIAKYYLHTSDSDAEAYIKKNSLKFMKFVIENFSLNDFCFFLNKNIFITKRNIDKFIDHAVQYGKTDISEILSDYKINMK